MSRLDPAELWGPATHTGTSGATVAPVATSTATLTTSAETIPVASTTDDLKAGPGSLATAIVAPKGGDIPVKAGTPVVVVAKALLDSPTVKKLLNVVYVAWGAFATFVGYKIIAAGGVFGLDWTSLLHGGVNLAIVTALAAYGIKIKAADNDPVISTDFDRLVHDNNPTSK